MSRKVNRTILDVKQLEDRVVPTQLYGGVSYNGGYSVDLSDQADSVVDLFGRVVSLFDGGDGGTAGPRRSGGVLIGTDGADVVDVGGDTMSATLGRGNDRVTVTGGNATVVTGKGNDTLVVEGKKAKPSLIDPNTRGTITFPDASLSELSARRQQFDLVISAFSERKGLDQAVIFKDYYGVLDRQWEVRATDGTLELAKFAGLSHLDAARAAKSGYAFINPDAEIQGYRQGPIFGEGDSGLEGRFYYGLAETHHQGSLIVAVGGTDFSNANDVASLLSAVHAHSSGQVDALVAQIELQISQYGIKHVVLSGHSQGGLTSFLAAIRLSQRHPELTIDVRMFNSPGMVLSTGLYTVPYLPELFTMPDNLSVTHTVYASDLAHIVGSFFTHGAISEILVPATADGQINPAASHDVCRIIEHFTTQGMDGVRLNIGRRVDAPTQDQTSQSRTQSNDTNLDGALRELYSRFVEPLTQAAVPEYHRRFDFGTRYSNLQLGHTRVDQDTIYTPALGYGWNPEYPVEARDRGRADDVNRDLAVAERMEFFVDLPAGTYDVTVHLGDRDVLRQRVGVAVEGELMDVLTIPSGEFVALTYRVQVTDGQLSVALRDYGGTTDKAALNGLQVRRVNPFSPPVVNAERKADKTLVVLTHGRTNHDGLLGLLAKGRGIVTSATELVVNGLNAYVSIKQGRAFDAINNLIKTAESLQELKENIERDHSPPPEWIFDTALGLTIANTKRGLAPLDPFVRPVLLTDVEKAANTEELLKLHKGSEDFLALDWTKESDNGTTGVNFDNAEHRAAVERATNALFRLIRARVLSEVEKDPTVKFDLLLVGHSFGTAVNRELIARLAESEIRRHLDFTKVVALDPTIVEPKNINGPNADRYYWPHPEMTPILDAVTSYYQTKGVTKIGPIDVLDDQLITGQPLDGLDGGGPLGFFNRQVRVFSLGDGSETLRYRHWNEETDKLAGGSLTDVAFSPDGRWLVSSGENGRVTVFDRHTPGEVWSRRVHEVGTVGVAFLDGDRVVAVGAGGRVSVLDARTGEELWATKLNHTPTELAVSRDGRTFAVADRSGRVTVWAAGAIVPYVQVWQQRITVRGDLTALALSPTGGVFVGVERGSGHSWELWDVPTSTLLQRQPANARVRAGDFRRGDGLLAVGLGSRVELWQRTGNGYQLVREIRDHVETVHAVVFSADGSRLVTGGMDQVVFGYDMARYDHTGSLAKVTVDQAMLPVRDLAVSPDGRHVATVSFDKGGGPVLDIDVTDMANDHVGFIAKLFGFGPSYHNAVTRVYLEDIILNGGESFFEKKDSPRASRPGDLDPARNFALPEHKRGLSTPGNGPAPTDDSEESGPTDGSGIAVISRPENRVISEKSHLEAADYFTLDPGFTGRYEADSSNTGVLDVAIDPQTGRLTMTPVREGTANVTINMTVGVHTVNVTFQVTTSGNHHRQDLVIMQAESRTASERLDATEAELTKAGKTLNQAADEIATVQRQVNQAEADLTKLQSRAAKAHAEAQSAAQLRDAAARTASLLQSRLGASQTHLTSLRSRLRAAEATLAHKQRDYGQLDTATRRAWKNFQHARPANKPALRQVWANLNARRDLAEREVNVARQQVRVLNADTARAARQVQALRKDAAAADRRVVALDRTARQADLLAAALAAEADRLKERTLRPLLARLDALGHQVSGAVLTLTGTSTELLRTGESLARVTGQIITLREVKWMQNMGLEQFAARHAERVERHTVLVAVVAQRGEQAEALTRQIGDLVATLNGLL